MNLLQSWNELPLSEAETEISPCCGSSRWAHGMASGRPYHDVEQLFKVAHDIWWSLDRDDWLEAFESHPRIGETANPDASKLAKAWSEQEQAGVLASDCEIKLLLAAGNIRYEQRFGYRYLVCATGKSSQELLDILQARLKNDPAAELLEAASEQEMITQIRLRKWLGI